MLLGKICPELGGDETMVDIIGYNFYYSNRYSPDAGDVVGWADDEFDHRFRPLHKILLEGFARYNKPILLAETSHLGEDKNAWWEMILEETFLLKDIIPFYGICWYPILDRPDWDDLDYLHESGINGISTSVLADPIVDLSAAS